MSTGSSARVTPPACATARDAGARGREIGTEQWPDNRSTRRAEAGYVANARDGDPGAAAGSAEAAGDVVLRALLARVGEDLLRGVGLDQVSRLARPAQREERGDVGN